jgi:sugar O-acyltransferase (sialic acid O-acetyltransferase NeuD family)
MKNPIILIGGGDFAKKVIRLIEKIGSYEIIGYTDKNNLGDLFDIPYLGEDAVLDSYIQKYPDCSAALCIAGNMKLIHIKEKLVSKIKLLGFNFPNLISPNAYIDKTVEFGEGCMVFDYSYIDFYTVIGSYSIINLNTTIGHDTKIGNLVTISPETITGGGSKIGDYSFLGMNSTIVPYATITKKCIIGAGAVVTKNCDESGIYIGNPAKIKK